MLEEHRTSLLPPQAANTSTTCCLNLWPPPPPPHTRQTNVYGACTHCWFYYYHQNGETNLYSNEYRTIRYPFSMYWQANMHCIACFIDKLIKCDQLRGNAICQQLRQRNEAQITECGCHFYAKSACKQIISVDFQPISTARLIRNNILLQSVLFFKSWNEMIITV